MVEYHVEVLGGGDIGPEADHEALAIVHGVYGGDLEMANILQLFLGLAIPALTAIIGDVQPTSGSIDFRKHLISQKKYGSCHFTISFLYFS